ncbi:MAG: pyridoxamine 5'-phosphate oxidase family protein [Clostridia bacterium]|nr:pyridoxamine 5'-phosphate oxidase family protein [Clostridia bacterium]
MSKAYDFLKECGSFFVLTVNGNCPAGRPFGAIMEVDEYLYLATNDRNQAHRQMRANEHIQIVAKRPDTRDWIRISGIAAECGDLELKQRMLAECPILAKRFDSVTDEHFLLFRVQVETVEIK